MLDDEHVRKQGTIVKNFLTQNYNGKERSNLDELILDEIVKDAGNQLYVYLQQ